MEYREVGGRLFEVTVVAEARGDALAAVELFEMGADGGMIGTIRDVEGEELTVSLYRREGVPVSAIEWWIGIARHARGE